MEMIDASRRSRRQGPRGGQRSRALRARANKGAEKSARAAADAALDRADDEVEAALASVRETAERSAKSLVSSLLGLRQEERSVEIVTGAVLALPPPNVTLESINGELATVQVDPAGMTWDAYRALRAQDPAANDADANEAAAYGTNGWRGSYRRYVADAVQVATVEATIARCAPPRRAAHVADAAVLEASEGPHAAPRPSCSARDTELEGLGADSLEDLGLDDGQASTASPTPFRSSRPWSTPSARRRDPTRPLRAPGL